MILLLLVTSTFLFFFHHFYWKRRNLPPGPLPLPFLGNLTTLGKFEPGYEAWCNWKEAYGPIYTFWLGPNPFVVIADYEKIKETFIRDGDAYTGKYYIPESNKIFRGGIYGIIDSTGDTWRDHRRFAIHQMRDFGVGKDLMQSKILLEVEFLVQKFKQLEGAEVNVQEALDIAVGCVINQFLFGYRFDDSRLPEFLELKTILSLQMRKTMEPSALFASLYAWTKHFKFGQEFRELLHTSRTNYWEFFQRQVDEHRKEIDWDHEDSKDYVEAFLKEQRKRELAGDHETFRQEQMMNILTDLWIAGLETTSNTLAWALAYVLNYPEVQDKLHEEMSTAGLSGRQITMSNKNDLPYVNAFVNETQRCANLLPMNLPHVTTKDVVLNGYRLPAGTGVIAQISCVMLDEKIFPEPHRFNPDRFIDEKGQLKKMEELTPFSIGKRQCLGEGLARMELFLFTANLVNQFQVLPGKSGKPTLRKTFGITMQPLPYTCLLKSRSQ